MAVAVISRGIPGSGKSTFNRILKSVCKARGFSIAIHSTDDFHMVDGKYVFQMDKLAGFHRRNHQNFCGSMAHGINIVVVDNTNLKAKEYKNYIESAVDAGYAVLAVRFEPDEVEKHFARQVHGVPLDRLVIMRESLIASGATIGVTKEFFIAVDQFNDEYLTTISNSICDSISIGIGE